MIRILLAAPLLALAACNGTSISIDGENVSIHSNLAMDGGNFDLNGVELYPGSKVRDLKIDAKGGKEDSGKVAIQFEAPAALATVQAWYRDAFTKEGYTLTASGTGFTGTKADGDKVAIELTADGADKTRGKIELSK